MLPLGLLLSQRSLVLAFGARSPYELLRERLVREYACLRGVGTGFEALVTDLHMTLLAQPGVLFLEAHLFFFVDFGGDGGETFSSDDLEFRCLDHELLVEMLVTLNDVGVVVATLVEICQGRGHNQA